MAKLLLIYLEHQIIYFKLIKHGILSHSIPQNDYIILLTDVTNLVPAYAIESVADP